MVGPETARSRWGSVASSVPQRWRKSPGVPLGTPRLPAGPVSLALLSGQGPRKAPESPVDAASASAATHPAATLADPFQACLLAFPRALVIASGSPASCRASCSAARQHRPNSPADPAAPRRLARHPAEIDGGTGGTGAARGRRGGHEFSGPKLQPSARSGNSRMCVACIGPTNPWENSAHCSLL